MLFPDKLAAAASLVPDELASLRHETATVSDLITAPQPSRAMATFAASPLGASRAFLRPHVVASRVSRPRALAPPCPLPARLLASSSSSSSGGLFRSRVPTPRPAPSRGRSLVVSASLITPADTTQIWTALLASASFGYYANRTQVGGALSGPVCAMLAGALLANVGVLPPPGPHVSTIQTTVVSLATPLLLLGADLRVVFRSTRRLLGAFCLGSVATAVAASVSFYVLASAMHGVGSAPDGDGWKVAAALTAKNIGGGLNYVAVANTLGVSPGAFAAGITADNFFALAYFPIVSWLGGAPLPGGKAGAVVEDVGGGAADWISTDDDDDDAGGWREEIAEETETGTSALGASETGTSALWASTSASSSPSSSTLKPLSSSAPAGLPDVDVGRMCVALTLATAIVALSEKVAPPSLGALPTATLVSVLFATVTPPRWSSALAPAGDALGNLLLFIFFATAGAAGGPVANVFSYPALFGFLAVLYPVHIAVTLLVGRRVFGFRTPELLVASNANVGGPATAGALAAGKNWHQLVVPGMLAGNFGNAVGTFAGLGVAKVFYHFCW